MLFATGKYWIFLTIVFFAYWSFARNRRASIIFLLIASYYFYALWNIEFVPLLILISTIDFLTARFIATSNRPLIRKLLLSVSVASDIGTLFIFKYFNFFSSSINDLLGQFHLQTRFILIQDLVIPLGLSFVTFRSLSYVIDVYRKTAPATNQYVDYLAFVSFFPTLIAGPVVRARELLPQLRNQSFESREALDGIFLIMVGLVKKVAIADVLATNLVDRVFDQPQLYSSVETLAAIYGYALQIYYDFSGYSDIAIGSALLLGIKLPENFHSPYRAQSLREFWKRWHITLSNWLFDYVYISIGGLRKRRFNLYRNLVLTFLVGGLWHGAAWTLLVWGGLHGVGLSVNHWWCSFRKQLGVKTTESRWREVLCVLATFHFICLTWIVFRAESLQQALSVLQRLTAFKFSVGNIPVLLVLLLLIVYLIHWLPERFVAALREGWQCLPSPAQAAVILSTAFGLYYVSGAEVQFIYGNF
ncbi:MAG TPA: MBOAT family protein [Pyrinomonadaceae bacterium]|nr:MBOAT family protein [Pyrinomonadaceae bacterium]